MKVKEHILKPLKKYCGTNEDCVNKFLVSIFLELHALKPNAFLTKYIIGNENFLEFKKNVLSNISSNEFDIEKLIEAFEFVISPEDKIITGAIYTPKYIREYIIKETFKNIKNLDNIKVIDFACGCGSFLIDAAIYIYQHTKKELPKIFEENIFGIDIEKFSIERTKIIFNILLVQNQNYNEINKYNLYSHNSLDKEFINILKIKNNIENFDVVLGNPPYVCSRNISDESKKLLNNWDVCKIGLPDLYIPFFQIGLDNLNNNGKLGYITMNTFFKSLNATYLREYFAKNKIFLKIIDFKSEQVFKGRSTYTCIVIADKSINSHIKYTSITPNKLHKAKRFLKIKYEDLNHKQGWNLQDVHWCKKIESIGTPLHKLYKITSGIATLKNDVYIIKPIEEDVEFYYLQTGDKIEKNICKKVINSNKLTSNNINIEQIIYPLIFPYYFKDNTPKLISEQNFIQKYPFTYQYLLKHKEILLQRDKGKAKNYPAWYAFGRTQNLQKAKYKMFYPQLAKEKPFFYISTDEDLYGFNGMMVIGKNLKELILLKQIMSSDIFFQYIQKTSKTYSSNYYSLGLRYIKNFTIPNISKEDFYILINTKNYQTIKNIINKYYDF